MDLRWLSKCALVGPVGLLPIALTAVEGLTRIEQSAADHELLAHTDVPSTHSLASTSFAERSVVSRPRPSVDTPSVSAAWAACGRLLVESGGVSHSERVKALSTLLSSLKEHSLTLTAMVRLCHWMLVMIQLVAVACMVVLCCV